MPITDDFESGSANDELDTLTGWQLHGAGQAGNPGEIQIQDVGGDARIEYTNYAFSSGSGASRVVGRDDGTFPNDQYAEMTLDTLDGSVAALGPAVRCGGAGGEQNGTGYSLGVGTSFIEINESVSGANGSQLVNSSSANVAAGSVFTMQAVGSTLIAFGIGKSELTTTDATLTSGNPGVIGTGSSSASTTEWDDFRSSELDGEGPPIFHTVNGAVEISTTTTLTIPAPAGIADDDLLVVGIQLAAQTGDISLSGWTLLENTSHDGGSYQILHKIASSESGSYAFTWTGNSRAAGWIIRVEGADTTTPFIATPSMFTDSDDLPDPPASGTVASGDYLAIASYSHESQRFGSTVDPPSGYILRGGYETTGGGGPASHCTVVVATQEFDAITSEDPGTFQGQGSDGWAASTILVQRGAAGGDATTNALTVSTTSTLSGSGEGSAETSALTVASASTLFGSGEGAAETPALQVATVSSLAATGEGAAETGALTVATVSTLDVTATGGVSVTTPALTAATVSTLSGSGEGSAETPAVSVATASTLTATAGGGAEPTALTVATVSTLDVTATGEGSATTSDLTVATISALSATGEGDAATTALAVATVSALTGTGEGSAETAQLAALTASSLSATAEGDAETTAVTVATVSTLYVTPTGGSGGTDATAGPVTVATSSALSATAGGGAETSALTVATSSTLDATGGGGSETSAVTVASASTLSATAEGAAESAAITVSTVSSLYVTVTAEVSVSTDPLVVVTVSSLSASASGVDVSFPNQPFEVIEIDNDHTVYVIDTDHTVTAIDNDHAVVAL